MYNLSFIWINAGKVEFLVDSTVVQNKQVYVFKSTGTSYTSYDWVMKVREGFSSVADCKNLKPLKYIRKSVEGSYFANENYEFNYSKNKIFSKIENSKQKLKYDTLELKQGTIDLLTAIYVCRNIDFTKYSVGDIIPLNIIIDNNCELLNIKYLGPETILNREEKSYNCLKFSASVVAGTIFKKDESMFIWVSNDNSHTPIYIEASILVGTVKAYITN